MEIDVCEILVCVSLMYCFPLTTNIYVTEGCGIRSPSGSGRVSEPEDELPERDPLPPSNMVLRKRIKRIRQGMRRCVKVKSHSLVVKQSISLCVCVKMFSVRLMINKTYITFFLCE